jgi:hypothetical protein
MPAMEGENPMCLDEQWVKWIHAYMNQQEPSVTGIGVGYMLQGDAPTSNTDPYAKGPTPDNEWMKEIEPHIMLIVPESELYLSLPTDPATGGPWVMFRDTPYVHIMIPVPVQNGDGNQ